MGVFIASPTNSTSGETTTDLPSHYYGKFGVECDLILYPVNSVGFMHEMHDLELLFKSQTPIIVIESHEEKRVVEKFRKLAPRLGLPLSKWTVTTGLQRLAQGRLPQKFNTQPIDVLKHIKSTDIPGIYLLLDFHPYLEDPVHTRLIREIGMSVKSTPRYLVFLSPHLEVPKEFAQLTAKFQLSLPTQERVVEIIKKVAVEWTQNNPGRKVIADKKLVQLLARNLTGLTASDAERLARKAIFDDGAITKSDLDRVMKAKYELINQQGVLSFEYETAHFGDVGGLNNLKRWLSLRRGVFHGDGKAYGLETPKGVLLLGVQGCGKSLAAKAVAGVWNVPLLRLDFAALYNKYMGETERNLRESLKTAETMAPCVLWIDEIEKGLSGGDGDDGVSRRVLGTLLTWMSEKVKPVFIVATANDVTSLPPELLRKGRFDELFFVDLPDDDSRRIIFEIQLGKRKLESTRFDLNALSQASGGFSGSEIEQAVVASLYAAIAGSQRVATQHILAELSNTKPLSVLMHEKVAALRQWAAARTVPAN